MDRGFEDHVWRREARKPGLREAGLREAWARRSSVALALAVVAAFGCSAVGDLEAETADAMSPGAYRLPSLFSLSSDDMRKVFEDGKRSVQPDGCNTVAFAQVEPRSAFFLGRETLRSDCTGEMGLTLSQLVTVSGRYELHKVARIFDPSSQVFARNGFRVTTAYDPSTVVFGGTRWVAFECHGVGFGPMAASCAAPLSEDMRSLDTTRLSVIVDGGSVDSSNAYVYSASVPKLLVFQNHLYLYWSSVRARKPGDVWMDITTRGAELEVNGGYLAVKGRSTPIKPDDPTFSVEVWGTVENDARQNSVADVFQVYTDGSSVYALAAVGGWNKALFPSWESRVANDPREDAMCLTPASKVAGCYRLAIARSPSPLATRGFNVPSAQDSTRRVDDGVLPANPQEYSRVMVLPTGETVIAGMYLDQVARDPGKVDVGRNMWMFYLPGSKPDATETLINHYYVSILERQPDAGGMEYWKGRVREREDAGLDVKPVFRDMASFFFNSAEYLGRNTTDRQFVTNLYRTFFQRTPDDGGMTYWLSRLAPRGDLSRNDVLQGFVDAREFTNFMSGLGF